MKSRNRAQRPAQSSATTADGVAPVATDLTDRIAALQNLTAQQLRDEWRRLYRGQPPRLSRDLLIRSIAYRMQELAYGGLSKATQRTLATLAKELAVNGSVATEAATPDPALIRLVIRAHGIRAQLLQDRSLTLEEIAKSHGFVPSYATRLFRLTLLAPDIVAALIGGRQPPELTARKLMDDTRLPLDWNEQRRTLGFAQPL